MSRLFFSLKVVALSVCAGLTGCAVPAPQTSDAAAVTTKVIQDRRSIRKYAANPVGRDTMQQILTCGLLAPSAINRQPWQVRIVDNQELLRQVSEACAKGDDKLAEQLKSCRNMFRDATTLACVARDTANAYSFFDCGLLCENLMLSATSYGVGSVCMGGPLRSIMGNPDAQFFIDRLAFDPGYQLCMFVGFGHGLESPDPKPRDMSKGRFVE